MAHCLADLLRFFPFPPLQQDENEISECSWRSISESMNDTDLLEENGMLRGILERYRTWSSDHTVRLGWDDLRLGSTLRENQQMYDIMPKL